MLAMLVNMLIQHKMLNKNNVELQWDAPLLFDSLCIEALSNTNCNYVCMFEYNDFP